MVSILFGQAGGDGDDLRANDFIVLPAKAVGAAIFCGQRSRCRRWRAMAGQTGGVEILMGRAM
jgi:hypothetical protein